MTRPLDIADNLDRLAGELALRTEDDEGGKQPVRRIRGDVGREL